MVNGKRREKETVSGIKHTAFMWLCFWKPLWTRGVCVLICAELDWQYLPGLNIYLACSFPTGHGITGILWNLGRCLPDRRCQRIWLHLTNCVRESYTCIALDGIRPSVCQSQTVHICWQINRSETTFREIVSVKMYLNQSNKVCRHKINTY